MRIANRLPNLGTGYLETRQTAWLVSTFANALLGFS